MPRHLKLKLIALMALSCLLCGCSESVLYRADESDFNEWVEKMYSPALSVHLMNISNWMKANMKYEPDGLLDYFKPWQRAWNQTGDCEDFSGVALEALHRKGRTEFVFVSVFYGSDGHTVCSNKQYHISNWGVFGVNAPTYEGIADHVSAGNWKRYIVRSRDFKVLQEVNR